MEISTTKAAILRLTENEIEQHSVTGWSYKPAGNKFVLHMSEGLSATLFPAWTFKKFFGLSQPYVEIDSALVRKNYKIVFGKSPDQPIFRYRYQQIWQKQGLRANARSFWETLDDTNLDPSCYLISDIPSYLNELFRIFYDNIYPSYNFSSEMAFLESVPSQYDYNGFPMYSYSSHLIIEIMKGNKNAVHEYRTNQTVPQKILALQNVELHQLQSKIDVISLI